MTTEASAHRIAETVPAHVPPHLILPYEPQLDPIYPTQPWLAHARAHHGMPDIFWTQSMRGGSWIVTRYALIQEILQTPENFSSRNQTRGAVFVTNLIPVEIDPPQHTRYRILLNPVFSPAAVAHMEAGIRDVVVSAIEAVRAQGRCEFVESISSIIPTMVFAEIFGLPRSEYRRYLGWVGTLLNSAVTQQDRRKKASDEIVAYLKDLIGKRRINPQNDLMSKIILSEDQDGKRMTDDEVLSCCYLIFIAGLDTVLNAMSNSFHILATNLEKQAEVRAIVGNPQKLAAALEEFLRYNPIITTNRICTRDMDFHGVQFKAGDPIIITLALANFDPREYKDPFKVDLDREPRHLTFASGPHRCVGSHLARRELQILFEEWFKRIPEFRLQEGVEVRYHPGVIGVEKLPLTWTA